MTQPGDIVVLGGGAWGSALAASLVAGGQSVHVWAREQAVANALSSGQGNPAFLPDITLPAIGATTDLAITAQAKTVLAVVPAQFARDIFTAIRAYLQPGTPVVLCAKGIEADSLCMMSEVLEDTLPHAVTAVLSGPSFASDVSRGLPTALTLAVKDEALGADLMRQIGRPAFRPYWTDDIIGAEIGGAVKNVLAIACGIVEGLGLGRSAHAALISRGFSEMTRLAIAKGARPETLAGLCGLGDLVLTCSSTQSRNMSFGKALGEGSKAEDILSERTAVTEGVTTAPALTKLAARHQVDMPICQAVTDILAGRVTVPQAIDDLLSRPFKEEF